MDAMMKKTTEQEQKGRDIFISIIEKKNENNEYYQYEILETTNHFSPYDLQIQKHNLDDWGDYEISYHEVKLRNENYSFTDFPDSYIDEYKVNQLKKIAYSTGKKTYINMIYPKDRVMLIWEIEPDKIYYPRYADKVSWKSKSDIMNENITISKNFVLLPNDEAVKIRY